MGNSINFYHIALVSYHLLHNMVYWNVTIYKQEPLKDEVTLFTIYIWNRWDGIKEEGRLAMIAEGDYKNLMVAIESKGQVLGRVLGIM